MNSKRRGKPSLASNRTCGDCRYFGDSCSLHRFAVSVGDEACGSFIDKDAKYASEYIPEDDETEGGIYTTFDGDA